MTQVSVQQASDPNVSLRKEENAKKAVFGAFQGFIIVSIIMGVLFRGAWWSVIPILATGYGFIEALFLYQDRKNGVHPKLIHLRKDTLGSWFAFVLVSYIMSSISFGAWWGVIPIVVLFFGAIGKTLEYPTKKRHLEAELQIRAPIAQPSIQPLERVQPVSVPVESQIVENGEEKHGDQYCPFCGNKLEHNAKFCGLCGQQL